MVRLDSRFRKDLLPVDFKVTSMTPVSTDVIWRTKSFRDGDELPPVKGYNLYFNEVPNRYYVKLNDDLITETKFTHNTPKYTKFPRGYYIIEAVFEDDTTMKSSLRDMYPPFDLNGQKIAQQELFYVMSRHSAQIDIVPVWVYGRKGFGNDRCTCTPEGMGPLKAKCPTCLGTGFKGGYHEPVLAFVSYQSPFQKSQTHLGPRVSQETPNQAILPAELCIVNPDDYVREIEAPFRLFAVTSVTVTEYGNVPMVQFLNLQLEESGHSLWQLKPQSIIMPKNIHYTKVRETYEHIFESAGQVTEDPFA